MVCEEKPQVPEEPQEAPCEKPCAPCEPCEKPQEAPAETEESQVYFWRGLDEQSGSLFTLLVFLCRAGGAILI